MGTFRKEAIVIIMRNDGIWINSGGGEKWTESRSILKLVSRIQ